MIATAPGAVAAVAAPHPPLPPQQLGLAGLPPAEPEVRVAIVGHLQRRGELRISTDGRAHLTVQVLQPGDDLPFVAMRHERDGATRDDLEHLARALLPGTVVVLTGHGLRLGEHEGEQVLRILRCNALSLGDPALFFPARAPAHPPTET